MQLAFLVDLEGLVPGALAAVDVQDLSGHEGRRLEIEDSTDHVLDLAHPTDGVQRAQSRIGALVVDRRFDNAERNGIYP